MKGSPALPVGQMRSSSTAKNSLVRFGTGSSQAGTPTPRSPRGRCRRHGRRPRAGRAARFAKQQRWGSESQTSEWRLKRLCTPEQLHLAEEKGECTITVEWLYALPARSFPACRPLRPRGAARCIHPVPSRDALAFTESHPARHSRRSTISGLTGSLLLRPAELLASLPEAFTSGFRRIGHPPRRRV
jgi:hypothetical protein